MTCQSVRHAHVGCCRDIYYLDGWIDVYLRVHTADGAAAVI